MTTDFRALCARMADELDHYRQLLTDNRLEVHALSTEARAALAASEQGPTDEELNKMAWNWFCQSRSTYSMVWQVDAWRDFARAVLARWGRPAPEQGPTDQELYDVAEQFNGDPVPAMRRALELWGHPAVEPVPLSERLPGPEDCFFNPGSKLGSCWFFRSNGWWALEPSEWVEDDEGDEECLYWLPYWAVPNPRHPHWALPLPQEGE